VPTERRAGIDIDEWSEHGRGVERRIFDVDEVTPGAQASRIDTELTLSKPHTRSRSARSARNLGHRP